MGQISLEFYQKKKSRWPFSDECIPWEVWSIKVNVVNLANEQERQICREKVGEKLGEKVINVVEVINRHEYLPKMPTQSEVDNVFDTSLKDVQPYLYKITFQITDSLGTSVSTTMKRLIKDTLALWGCVKTDTKTSVSIPLFYLHVCPVNPFVFQWHDLHVLAVMSSGSVST